MSYSGELKVHIRIHMCRGTKKKTKQEEECGERASERAKERRRNKYGKRSGLRPRPSSSVRPLRKSSACANRANRSFSVLRSWRRGKLISIMGSGGGGGDSDPSSSSGGKEQKRGGGLAEHGDRSEGQEKEELTAQFVPERYRTLPARQRNKIWKRVYKSTDYDKLQKSVLPATSSLNINAGQGVKGGRLS